MDIVFVNLFDEVVNWQHIAFLQIFKKYDKVIMQHHLAFSQNFQADE